MVIHSDIIVIRTISYVPVYLIIQDDHFLISMIISQLQSILYNINIVSILFQYTNKEMGM